MKSYRPSGRIPFGGLIGLLLATIIGSFVIGGIVFAISHLIYLVILFPLFMGLLGGGFLSLVVKSSKIRSPIIAGFFGLLLGIGIIGVNRFAEYYIDFRDGARTAIVEEGGDDVSQQEIDEFIDFVLEDETGSPGFLGYLKYTAQEGTTITRTTSGSDMTLDETGTWVYWGIELLIVMVISAVFAFKAASQPFNEEAGDWYPPGQWIGNVDWKQRKDFYKLLKNGDTLSAFKMVSAAPMTAPRVDVLVQHTLAAPQTDVILKIMETRLNRRKEISADKKKGVVSAQEFATLSRMAAGSPGASVSTVQSV